MPLISAAEVEGCSWHSRGQEEVAVYPTGHRSIFRTEADMTQLAALKSWGPAPSTWECTWREAGGSAEALRSPSRTFCDAH